MPPAFNLSQDQTLQLEKLDLLQELISTLTLIPSITGRDKLHLSCEHFDFCDPQSPPVPQASRPAHGKHPRHPKPRAPTPIGCQFLKSRPTALVWMPCGVRDSHSISEDRDYSHTQANGSSIVGRPCLTACRRTHPLAERCGCRERCGMNAAVATTRMHAV